LNKKGWYNGKKKHTVGTVPNYNRKIAETCKIDIRYTCPITFISWYKDFNKTAAGLNQFTYAPIQDVFLKWCGHASVSRLLTPIYIWMNSVVRKNSIILIFMHNIFNPRDTDVVICIIIVILKRADCHNHRLNSRLHTKPLYDKLGKLLSTLNQNQGPPWSWSYGSCIQCNQCLSLLKL
jgi:hypothetical protein